MRSNAKRKVASFIAMATMVCCMALVWMKVSSASPVEQPRPASYEEMIALPEVDLARVDVALMNLRCAEGLPGSERLNVKTCLMTFDQWASLVKQSEKKYSAQYDRNPQRYDNSIAKFKAVNLALTLKQDLGCGYNKGLVTSGAMADFRSTRFFRNSGDLFLHGFVENRKGSCSSLPLGRWHGTFQYRNGLRRNGHQAGFLLSPMACSFR